MGLEREKDGWTIVALLGVGRVCVVYGDNLCKVGEVRRSGGLRYLLVEGLR